MKAHAINEIGHVIGTGRDEKAVPWTKNVPWIMWDDEVASLGYDGFAYGLNNSDLVAAMRQGSGALEASLYADGSIFVFPLNGPAVDSVQATRSTANAINADGVVAGSVCTQTGHNIRAAVFRQAHPPAVLVAPAVQWGTRTVDINNRGQVLVQADMGPGDVRSILWSFEDGDWELVGDGTMSVSPIAVTNGGFVLGDSSSLAMICEPGGA